MDVPKPKIGFKRVLRRDNSSNVLTLRGTVATASLFSAVGINWDFEGFFCNDRCFLVSFVVLSLETGVLEESILRFLDTGGSRDFGITILVGGEYGEGGDGGDGVISMGANELTKNFIRALHGVVSPNLSNMMGCTREGALLFRDEAQMTTVSFILPCLMLDAACM